MDFHILGPLEVLDGERVLDVGGGKQRGVLALLLIHANEVVSSDRLIEGLWPEEQPPSAAKIIQSHVSRLRKALAVNGDGVLLTRGGGYVLHVEPGQLDVDRFRHLLEEGREALAADDPNRAADVLREALALWRGAPLVDFSYDSFAQEEVARLDDLHLAALEEQIQADLALGRHDGVLQELTELVQRHPLRERFRGQLMLALYRAGRQNDALDVYREGRRRFADELGLEPSPSLQQLERAILNHDPALDAPTRRSQRETKVRRGGLLVVAGALLLIAAAIAVAVVELAGSSDAAGLPGVAPNSVGVIDPETNKIIDQIPVREPTQIAFGPSGVWVASQRARTLTQIDPQTRRVQRAFYTGGPPIDVTVGNDAAWTLVASDTPLGAGSARLKGFDPRFDTPRWNVRLSTSFVFGSPAFQGLAAAHGVIYVEVPSPRVTVTRIHEGTPNRQRVFTADGANVGPSTGLAGGTQGPSGFAVGRGALWAGVGAGVLPVAKDLRDQSSPIQLTDPPIPTAVAVSKDAVWVIARPLFRITSATKPGEHLGKGTLWQIHGSSPPVAFSIGGDPVGVAVGAGSIWIADSGTRSLIRFDPSTHDIKRIPLGARPHGVTFGNGLVWVSVG